MSKSEKWIELADTVRALFRDRLGEFRAEDFTAVADLLGFHACKKTDPAEKLKPIAENALAEIIGTNLNHAVEAYEWRTHIPMTEDGAIVSGFWDREKEKEPPEGYAFDPERRFLSRKG